jgi:competence protein ComEA
MESENFYPRIRENLLPIILGTVGIVLVVIGLFQFYLKKQDSPEVVFTQEKKDEQLSEQIIVDVEGAVMKPGVYKLSGEARIVDALAACGGLSEEADRVWVEKNINLASRISDGLKIYIPRAGEDILSQSTSKSNEAGGVSSVININTASQSDLESLPGVGEVTAGKIIEARPFAKIEDLIDKKIVGNATYEKIKDKIAAN